MNRKLVTGIFVAAICLAAVPAMGGPLQKNEIGAGANWVVHADLEMFRNTTFGKLFLAELQNQGLEEKLQSFETIFSFHPLRDVRDVTLYGQGQDRSNAVVIADGRFDPEKLVAVVRWNPQYQEIAYQGTTVHQWLSEEKKGDKTTTQMMYGYIHDGRQVVISSGLDALKQAVDTLKGPAGGAPVGANDDSPLLGRIPQTRGNTFVQVAATGVGQMVGEDPKAAVLRQTESLALAAGETGDKLSIELVLTSESVEVAENMVKMFQGILAWASLATEEQPKLSELAKNVSLSRADRTTQVRFEAPVQAVFEFLKEQWEQKKQQPKQAP
jgi:hypothetical protein